MVAWSDAGVSDTTQESCDEAIRRVSSIDAATGVIVRPPAVQRIGHVLARQKPREVQPILSVVQNATGTREGIRAVVLRVEAEYREMPGLKLTEPQAQRLLGIDCDMCAAVLGTLLERGFLRRTRDGLYLRAHY